MHGKDISENSNATGETEVEKKIIMYVCAAYIGIGGVKIEDEPRH